MWFVFPQIAGLGHSELSQRYAISCLEEARAYLSHEVLGPRLRECADVLLSSPEIRAVDIFGAVDAMKLRSSMTLFALAAPEDERFAAVLDRYFSGERDQLTEALVGG